MPDHSDQPSGRTKAETVFLACLAVGTLLAALGFVIATVAWGYGFPSTMVAILLGICIATLAYTFLGGVGGAVFKLGGFELAGAAALILIVFYLVDGPMAKGMKDVQAIQLGRTAEQRISSEQAKTVKERERRQEAERRLSEVQSETEDRATDSVAGLLTRIEKSTADDRLGKGVLSLLRDGKGPFDPTIATLTLPVRFNHQVTAGTFQFCHDSRAELRGKPVRFELVNAEAGTSESIVLRPGADIGPGLCAQIKFDVALGCDAVGKLLPNAISKCDSTSGVAWIDPASGRTYELTATTLNPDLVPGL